MIVCITWNFKAVLPEHVCCPMLVFLWNRIGNCNIHFSVDFRFQGVWGVCFQLLSNPVFQVKTDFLEPISVVWYVEYRTWIVSVKCHTLILRIDAGGILYYLFSEDVSNCNPIGKIVFFCYTVKPFNHLKPVLSKKKKNQGSIFSQFCIHV